MIYDGQSGAQIVEIQASSSNPATGIPTVSSNPNAIYGNQQAATSTAVSLQAQPLVNGVVIQALPTNTGSIYVGPAGTTPSTGYPLAAGQPISYGVKDVSDVYIVLGSGASGGVAWTGN